MARKNYGAAINHVCTLFDVGTVGSLTDGQLLERFLADDRQAAELAFAALVDRHGSMVLRVCNVVLRNEHDALDAFQASFLILVHKARSLRVHDSLGPWLHQVALRVASCARSAALRRRKHERTAAEMRSDRICSIQNDESIRMIVHSEIDRLPERYRRPIVLCCLEGCSREEAAIQLGWPVGTVQSRLARGRERLRASLLRRGVVGPAVAVSLSVLSTEAGRAAVSEQVTVPLVRAAAGLVVGRTMMAESISTAVLTLTEGVLKMMLATHVKLAATAVLAVGVVVTGAGVWASQRPVPAGQRLPDKQTKAEVHAAAPPAVVARVNGMPITREQLAERCLAKYGSKEIRTLISAMVIEKACKRRGISVGDDEVGAEIALLAQKVGMSSDAWYDVLLKQRGISKQEYQRDIVATNLKLRRLGVDVSKSNGSDVDMRDIIKQLDGQADVEILWDQPAQCDEAAGEPARRSQEDRLRDVEDTLRQVLRSLEELKRQK